MVKDEKLYFIYPFFLQTVFLCEEAIVLLIAFVIKFLI